MKQTDQPSLSNSPSIDRIDPSKGYTKDNVWVISRRANTIKSNATVDEVEKVAQGLRQLLGKDHDSTPGSESGHFVVEKEHVHQWCQLAGLRDSATLLDLLRTLTALALAVRTHSAAASRIQQLAEELDNAASVQPHDAHRRQEAGDALLEIQLSGPVLPKPVSLRYYQGERRRNALRLVRSDSTTVTQSGLATSIRELSKVINTAFQEYLKDMGR